MNLTAIKESALLLSANEKAELIDALWDDLEPARWQEVGPAWGAEAEQRIDAVEAGKLPCVDQDQVFKTLRASLPK